MEYPSPELVLAAKEAQRKAYAPYSGYRVGAAVLDEGGQIHAGCNVENVSFGLCLCAERSAVAQMVTAGGKQVRAVAVVTKDGGTPCGMCRQVLAEFVPAGGDIEVHCINESGERRTHSLRTLLPEAFQSDAVERTPSRSEGST